MIEYDDDEVEVVELQDTPKCFYCDLELDDGCTFAGDMLFLDRFYCMSCLEDNMEEIEQSHYRPLACKTP
jgi:hypothetical protein